MERIFFIISAPPPFTLQASYPRSAMELPFAESFGSQYNYTSIIGKYTYFASLSPPWYYKKSLLIVFTLVAFDLFYRTRLEKSVSHKRMYGWRRIFLRQGRSCEKKLSANVLSVHVMTDRFKEPYYSRSTTIELPVATSDTQELIGYGLRAVESLYREGLQFKKGGVMLTDLVESKHIQQNLFDTKDRERSRRLMQAVDRVNAHLGAGTLRFAVAGINQKWKVLANHKSKHYTTCWEELVRAKA